MLIECCGDVSCEQSSRLICGRSLAEAICVSRAADRHANIDAGEKAGADFADAHERLILARRDRGEKS